MGIENKIFHELELKEILEKSGIKIEINPFDIEQQKTLECLYASMHEVAKKAYDKGWQNGFDACL